MAGTLALAGTSFPYVAGVFNRRRIIISSVAATAPAARESDRKRSSLYEVLRVRETATASEIKSAYRLMAKRFHPDVAAPAMDGGDAPDFVEIQTAYETLSDPAARASYDLSIGRRRRPRFVGTEFRCRRWETDQCW